ncbi:uncharacterized protein EMH_0019500 [Eimeria mitis]|uniref:Retrotransposon gag domain-containing protein n=1 Tax=Eimeria mitis TaxID=44415 RepID=U6KFL4_9EIME|nr:uncharacterized protein EMH_0019500 [Eimeria mitis]CDJ34263.1 hypothetical protein EMH_0019500 [Eimeria mitis]
MTDESRVNPESRANTQKESSIRKGIAATDDGTNMRFFLCLIKQEFRELEVPEEQWGLQLRKYLTGKAMAHWELLQRSGTELSDWKLVRERLCERFCTLSREMMLEQMRNNPWRGDYNEYISRFAEIVAQGETLAAEELVLCFSANIPVEIGDRLTQDGNKDSESWQEASAA